MSSPPGSPIGATLGGKYRIVRLVGEGGMGAVYEGENMRVARRVGVKLIAPDLAQNKEIVARFRREALVTSRILSEHIVSILDVDEDPNFGLYLVMELLRGQDLGERLKFERNLPLETALTIAYHTAMALGAAHEAKVIHRDLKPANIFLHELSDKTTIVKVVDFGISKLLIDDAEAKADTALTRVGTIVGTLQYMAPEQALGEQVDHRADIWSLGCVLYELLAGKPAYPQAKTLEEAYRALMKGRPALLAQVAPWVSPKLVELVEDCMQRKVERRVPDAGTFTRRLAAIAPEIELAANMRAPQTAPSLPPIAGDETIVSSDEELAEIRRSSKLQRDSGRGKTTIVKPKAKQSIGGADSATPFLGAHVAGASPEISSAAQEVGPSDPTDDDPSVVARPSDIRALRRLLIQHEKHELGLPNTSDRPPARRWIVALFVAVVVLSAAFILGMFFYNRSLPGGSPSRMPSAPSGEPEPDDSPPAKPHPRRP